MHCLTWHNRSNHLPADSAVVTGGIAGCALTGVAVRGPGGGGEGLVQQLGKLLSVVGCGVGAGRGGGEY